MTFTDWWNQLTQAERKVIGESNAKFVWEECQKYTLMTIEDASHALPLTHAAQIADRLVSTL